jgi:hypothetical protein
MPDHKSEVGQSPVTILTKEALEASGIIIANEDLEAVERIRTSGGPELYRFVTVLMVFENLLWRGAKTLSAEWLHEIAVALGDLEIGVVHPLLKPVTVKHRRVIDTPTWGSRAMVAVAAEVLGRTMSKDEAAQWIARKYPGLATLIRKQGRHSKEALRKAIVGWSNELRKSQNDGRVRNVSAGFDYFQYRERAAAVKKSDSVSFADWLLQEVVKREAKYQARGK